MVDRDVYTVCIPRGLGRYIGTCTYIPKEWVQDSSRQGLIIYRDIDAVLEVIQYLN